MFGFEQNREIFFSEIFTLYGICGSDTPISISRRMCLITATSKVWQSPPPSAYCLLLVNAEGRRMKVALLLLLGACVATVKAENGGFDSTIQDGINTGVDCKSMRCLNV